MRTSKETIEEKDNKVSSITLTYESSGFIDGHAVKETLTVNDSGDVRYREIEHYSDEVLSACNFKAKTETVAKLFDRIGKIYAEGKMVSSDAAIMDAGTFTAEVVFDHGYVCTEGWADFPEWTKPILKSLRRMFLNNGFKPGLLFYS